MKIKVAEWIACFLVEQGIRYNFTVPGGGAMHMNIAFGYQDGMNNIFVQHEQAAAMAAEAFQRINNELPLVCCTSGPGGTNTITGVMGAWLDSIPMLVISGQVRYSTTARSTGLPLRSMGPQEFDIVKAVSCMTKYAEMVVDANTIKYHLQKAIFLATNGRPGPVWLDIPLDVQGGYIDTDNLIEFNPSECIDEVSKNVDNDIVDCVLKKIIDSKRPVFNAGNGIRIAGAYDAFNRVIHKLNIPVVTGWDSIDLISDDDDLYVGRAGTMGNRPGNWAIQNSDLIISVGSRLGTYQVGYNKDTWAREAYVIMVDIDEAELKKPTIHVEFPICADAKEFLELLDERIDIFKIERKSDWISRCSQWKKEYPVVQEKHYKQKELANVYCFMKELSTRLSEGQLTVTGNGSACVVGSNAYVIKKGQRFIMNQGASSMGYDLPASIGASFARNKDSVICLSGDGSIQMNLQELQTIVFHKLPIKIFVINNEGYHSMRQTEENLFPEYDTTIGVGPESKDLSFPCMKKISEAYGIPYYKIDSNDMGKILDDVLNEEKYALCEIFVDTKQKFEPKSATKKLKNGTLISPPLEDLAPFLPREELERNMIIPLLSEVLHE